MLNSSPNNPPTAPQTLRVALAQINTTIGDFEGNESWLATGNIVAGNPKVFGQVLQVLAPHLTPALKTPV